MGDASMDAVDWNQPAQLRRVNSRSWVEGGGPVRTRSILITEGTLAEMLSHFEQLPQTVRPAVRLVIAGGFYQHGGEIAAFAEDYHDEVAALM